MERYIVSLGYRAKGRIRYQCRGSVTNYHAAIAAWNDTRDKLVLFAASGQPASAAYVAIRVKDRYTQKVVFEDSII